MVILNNYSPLIVWCLKIHSFGRQILLLMYCTSPWALSRAQITQAQDIFIVTWAQLALDISPLKLASLTRFKSKPWFFNTCISKWPLKEKQKALLLHWTVSQIQINCDYCRSAGAHLINHLTIFCSGLFGHGLDGRLYCIMSTMW